MNKLVNQAGLTFLFWSCISLVVVAQSDRYLDRVALKNGSILWGIVEIDENEVKVFLDDDHIVTVQDTLIKSLKYHKLNPASYKQRNSGIYYQLLTGLMVGKAHQYSENVASFAAWFSSGYKFDRKLGAGLGAGLNYYSQQRHIPLYLDIQGDLLAGRVTPYYQLNVGWSWADERESFSTVEKVEGGLFVRPAFGVKWHFPKHSWHFQVSYVRQNATTFYEPIDFGNGAMLTNVEDRVLQRMGLSFGISF
jgi:hypothetical protein